MNNVFAMVGLKNLPMSLVNMFKPKSKNIADYHVITFKVLSFLIKMAWGNDGLWKIENPVDKSIQYHLFDVSIVSRMTEGFNYSGLQIIVGKLMVIIART